MNFALYLNGVFESVLEEILIAQSKTPNLVCYLQPYNPNRFTRLASEEINPSHPFRVYISISTSLSIISYRAWIVGWEYKPEITDSRLMELNIHIKNHQPNEKKIFMSVNNKPCVNLLSVIEMERIKTPIPTSSLIKIDKNDPTPLKLRSQPGGISYVKPLPDWTGTSPILVLEELENQFEIDLEKSLKLTQQEREERLKRAPKSPEVIQTIARSYRRNQDVVAAVLFRANGVCEACGKNAPFIRASNGTPYLEVHHKIWLANGGEDTVENAIAVCPNCHRKFHFGTEVDQIITV